MKQTSVLIVGMALLALVGCGKEQVEPKSIRPVKVMEVGGAQVIVNRWFPGQAKAAQEVNLSFRVPGTLAEFPVNLGDEVQEGSLLARLDPRDYQVALRNAEAQLSKAQASLDLAKADFERVDRVRQQDPGAVSQALVDARRGERDAAQAQVASARTAVAAARDNLNYTYLKAPFSGTVVEKFVENFQDVQAKQVIVRVVDISRIEFVVQIPESLVAHTPRVHGALVVFDAFPERELPAQIKEIGKEASKTTRTYPVTLVMDQPPGIKILPGMAGKAKGDPKQILPGAEETAGTWIEIPISATFAGEGGKTYVWVVDDGKEQVARREVTPGNLTAEGILVEGLQPCERIVTAGVNSLVEGQKVRILE